jgi:hypothetical protein
MNFVSHLANCYTRKEHLEPLNFPAFFAIDVLSVDIVQGAIRVRTEYSGGFLTLLHHMTEASGFQLKQKNSLGKSLLRFLPNNMPNQSQHL